MSIASTVGKFFNDSDLDQVEGFINGVLSTPDIPKEVDKERVSSEFLNKFFEEEKGNKKTGEIDQLFQQFNVPAERLLRYSAYDEIYRSVSMVQRIIKVYKANIIQKNPINNLWYNLQKTDFKKDQKDEDDQRAIDSKDFFKDFLKNFKIAYRLKNSYLHNQLIYGDCFIEVIDLKKEKGNIDLKKINILNEAVLLEQTVDKFNRSTSDIQINETIETIAENLYTLVDVKEEVEEEETEDEKVKKEVEGLRFQNTLIRTHKPHNIIILETKYGTRLGYLEVSRSNINNVHNITQTLSNITNRIINISSESNAGGTSSTEGILNRIAAHILKKVTGKKKTKFDPSVLEDFKRFLIEQNIHRKQVDLKNVEVRFIPMNRMVCFSFPSSENYPYGGSIIEPLMLPGKLFILSQLSNIYMKLSRAPLTYSGLH